MKLLSTLMSVLFVVTQLFISGHAFADPPKPCTTPLSVTSPCVGVLLPPESAALGLKCLQIELPKLQLSVEQGKALFANYREYMNTVLKTERGHATDLKGLLDTSLKVQGTGAAWYEHPAFWFSVGFAVAAASTIGITYAVNSK